MSISPQLKNIKELVIEEVTSAILEIFGNYSQTPGHVYTLLTERGVIGCGVTLEKVQADVVSYVREYTENNYFTHKGSLYQKDDEEPIAATPKELFNDIMCDLDDWEFFVTDEIENDDGKVFDIDTTRPIYYKYDDKFEGITYNGDTNTGQRKVLINGKDIVITITYAYDDGLDFKMACNENTSIFELDLYIEQTQGIKGHRQILKFNNKDLLASDFMRLSDYKISNESVIKLYNFTHNRPQICGMNGKRL